MAAKLFFITLTILVYLILLLIVSRKKTIPFVSLMKAFLMGCISTVPVIGIKAVGIPLSFPVFILPLLLSPCLEESSKGLCIPLVRRLYNTPYLLGGMIGLGFACAENLLFVSGDMLFLSGNVLLILIMRLFLDTTAHFLSTSLLTLFSSKGKIMAGLIVTTFFHTTFNFVLSLGIFVMLIPLFLLMLQILRAQMLKMA